MTRRKFFSIAAVGAVPADSPAPLAVPVYHLLDSRANLRPGEIARFRSRIWPEAVRDFARCGIRLETSAGPGEIWRRPEGRQPVISGLRAGAINLAITDQVPGEWDNGRALSGVTTLYRNYHLSLIALYRAHGHQVPFLSVNTCVHELLHALLLDIFESRPRGLAGQAREFRVDWYATRLWLFHEGGAIRKTAASYVQRLRATV